MAVFFQRKITLVDATALVSGSMIGSGIFIVSADIARQFGSPGMMLIVWGLAAILTIIAAIVYGELSSMMPNVGGQYVYLREAYSLLLGFLYGWGLFTVIQIGTIAAVSMAFAKFSGVLFPIISESNIIFHVFTKPVSTVHVIALFTVVFLTLYNLQGIRQGKALQTVFTILKASVLLFFIIVGLFIVKNTAAIEINRSYYWDILPIYNAGHLSFFAFISTMAIAMVGALFSLDAWYNVTFASDEVINPQRNLPRSLIGGTIIVSVIYLLTNIVYLRCIPLRGLPDVTVFFDRGIQFAVNDRVGTAALQGLMGGGAASVMAVVIMISTFGCNNGIIISGARVFYSMARDGLFFRRAGILNSRGIPQNALIIQLVWSSVLCLSGSYHQLLDYVIFVVLIFLVLTCFAVIRLRKRNPDVERPYRAWGYPLTPWIFIAGALFIMVVLLVKRPSYTWPGLIIVALGIPVYYLLLKKRAANN